MRKYLKDFLWALLWMIAMIIFVAIGTIVACIIDPGLRG